MKKKDGSSACKNTDKQSVDCHDKTTADSCKVIPLIEAISLDVQQALNAKKNQFLF